METERFRLKDYNEPVSGRPEALSRGQDEESQQVLAEMRKAREIGELERRRLELQKSQLEEDGKAVRAENQSLREQLANEQRAAEMKQVWYYIVSHHILSQITIYIYMISSATYMGKISS